MDCSPEYMVVDNKLDSSQDLIEEFEDLYDVDLMCPYCHEVVELFNNDLQFSIDMHSQNDAHITAYKSFQENNITQKDKPPVSQTLDRQKNNAFILDSILKSISEDIAPINHPSFGDYDNINCLDTDTDLSKSLNDKLVLEESSCSLERLFMQLPTGYEYNIPYISMVGKKLFCHLCNCYIVKSLDQFVLLSNLKKHLEGSHQQNYLKELIKLLPKEQIEDEHYFILKPGRIMCKLCRVPICIALSGLKSTFYNLIIHLKGKKHEANLNTNFEDYSCLKQMFGSKTPKTIKRNKFYLIKNEEYYKCVLCNKNISLSGQDVSQTRLRLIEHLNSNNHLNKIQIFESISPSLDYEYLKQIIYPLQSQIIEQNMEHIVKNGEKFFKCTLCDVQLEIFSEPSVTVSQFSQHLKSAKHKQKIKVANTQNKSSEKVNQVTQKNSDNTQSKKCTNNDFDCLKTKLEGFAIPQIFDKNKQFIIKHKKHFKCTLCEKILEVSPDPSIIIFNFTQHLQSKLHEQNESKQNNCLKEGLQHFELPSHKCKKIECEKHLAESTNPFEYLNQSGSVDMNPNPSSSNNEYGILKEVFGPFYELHLVQKNKQYIIKLKKHLKCSLCDVQLAITSDPEKNILLFSQHLESMLHEQNKRQLENHFVERTENITLSSGVNNPINSSLLDNKLKFLSLEEALGTYYELQVIKHNTQYLTKEGKLFKCTLCNSQFRVSSEICINLLLLSLHLKSKIHKENRTDHVFKQLLLQSTKAENVNTALNIDYLYLQALLDPYPVPQYVERNKQFIIKNGSNFKCVLCDALIKVSTDPQSIIMELSAHFEIGFHNGKKGNHEKCLIQNVQNLTVGTQANSVNMPQCSFSTANKVDFMSLEAILDHSPIPRIIEQNKQYIVKYGNHFKCVLCDEQLTVLSDRAKTVLNFTQHFHSAFHKQNRINHNIYLEAQSTKPISQSSSFSMPLSPCLSKHESKQNTIKLNKDSITQQEKDYMLLKILLGPYSNLSVFEQNKQFFVKDGNHFKCTLCDAQLTVSSEPQKTVAQFTLHLDGKFHKTNILINQAKSLVDQAAKLVGNQTQCKKTTFSDPTLINDLDYNLPKKEVANNKNTSAKCNLCDISISISPDSATASKQLMDHFLGKAHKKKEKMSNDQINQSKNLEENSIQSEGNMKSKSSLDKNITDFLSLKAFLNPFPIPQIFEKNKDCMVKDNGDFKCTLCNVQLKLLSDVSKTVQQFSQHLNGAKHKRLFKLRFAKVDVKGMHSTLPVETNTCNELPDYIYLKEILHPHKIPDIFVQNKQYLLKKENNFVCILCDAQLMVSTVASKIVFEFSKHLNCANHKRKFEEVKVNIMYLTQSGPNFECSLCKSKFCTTSNYQNMMHKFFEHFIGVNHVKNVKALSNKQNVKSDKKQSLPPTVTNSRSNECNDKDVVLGLMKVLQANVLPQIIVQNRDYIVKSGDHYLCTLCKAQLCVLVNASSTITQFSQHLSSNRHTGKVAAVKAKLRTSQTDSLRNPSENIQQTTSTSIQDQVSKSLKEVFYPYNIPQTIKVNLSNIRKMGDHFVCLLCGVQLSVTSKPYFTILNFVQHLGSKNHTSKVNKK